jgi:hypothetical protein
MKNYVFLILLILVFSCAEKPPTGNELESPDELSQKESKSEIDTEAVTEEVMESLGLIGKWTIPSSFGGGELKIEHHLGKYYKNEELSDGTVNISEVLLKEEEGLKIFSLKDQSSEEKWIITQSGSLEVRGKDGLIYSSEEI